MLKETRYTALIVASNEKFASSLMSILSHYPFSLEATYDLESAKRKTLEKVYDFVIVTSPVGLNNGTEFVLGICDKGESDVIHLVKASSYNEAFDRTNEFGVMTIALPIQGEVLIQAVNMMISARAKLPIFKERGETGLKEKMKEIKLTNEAKILLIKNEGLSESDAHKKILKMAMDNRWSKLQVVKYIISKYSGKEE